MAWKIIEVQIHWLFNVCRNAVETPAFQFLKTCCRYYMILIETRFKSSQAFEWRCEDRRRWFRHYWVIAFVGHEIPINRLFRSSHWFWMMPSQSHHIIYRFMRLNILFCSWCCLFVVANQFLTLHHSDEEAGTFLSTAEIQ